MTTSPREDYARRRGEAEAQVQHLGRIDTRLSWSRLAAVALAVALGVASYRGAVRAVTLALPAVAFVALAITHDRVLQRRRRAATIGALYAAGLSRLDDAWAGQGDAGDAFRGGGAGPSVRRRSGSVRPRRAVRAAEHGPHAHRPAHAGALAGGTRRPPPRSRARQAAVAELAPRLELREELALAGGALAEGAVREEALSAWAPGGRAEACRRGCACCA